MRVPVHVFSVAAVLLVASACSPADPPTITPPPAGQPAAAPGGGQSLTMTLAPPAPPPVGTAEPVTIAEVTTYQDAGGEFTLDVPDGWTESRKTDELTGDGVLGTVFTSPNRNGLLSVTQFDNGEVPTSLSGTANGVMKLTGVVDERDFRELGRSSVIDRPGDAMLVELTYTRSNGVPMHGLMRFQIDGTRFSMVHLAVEQGSWVENEGAIRDVVASYRGPGVAPAPPTPTTAP